jgi:hypothetical protein
MTNTYNYTAPGDPGTNISSSETDKSNSDDTDAGTEDQTNGSITEETDNFTDTTDGSDDTSYNAASDQGAVSGPVTPFVPSLGYTRLVIQLGLYNEGEGFEGGGYSGPTTTTGTASASTHDDEDDLADGTTTDTNGTVNTDENFDDTGKSNDSGSISNSTTGGGGAYTASYSGSESDNGTDTDDGTIDNGVTKDTYNDTGTETDTINTSSSLNTGSAGNDEHNSNTYSGTDTQTSTVSGNYTTEPLGTQITPTTDNPGGYAISNQTIVYTENMTSTQTQIYSGDTTGPSYSISGNGDYTAKQALSVSSNSTVNVNVAQNIDTQSGSYSSNASESQVADYNDSGTFTSQYVVETWTFANHQTHSGYNNDSGTYGGTDSDTQGGNSTGSQSHTITETVGDYTKQGGYNTSTRSTGSVDNGNPWSNTTNGSAAKAPVVQVAFQAGQGGAARTPEQIAHGGKGIPLKVGAGPVSIIGIVGSLQQPRQGDAGAYIVARLIAQQIGAAVGPGAKPPTLSMYKSTPPDGQGQTVADIVSAEMERIRKYAVAVKAGNVLADNTYSVILLGHSYGADKAIDVAIALDAALRSTKNPDIKALFDMGKIDIHLITIDAIKRRTAGATPANDPRLAGLANIVASWQNYFQKDDTKTIYRGKVYNNGPVTGTGYPGMAADLDKTTLNDPKDNVNKHLNLPQTVRNDILKALGLPTVP